MTEKTLSTKTIYDGKIIKVTLDEVEVSPGKKSFREEVHHGGGACVLAVKDGKIPLVRQYRYAYKSKIWEIPAGKIEAGEDSEITAKRELIEEVGIRADSLTLAHKMMPSPGYTDEIIYIYIATQVSPAKQSLDDGEFLEVKYFTLDELLQMCASGEICDGKTLIAIYHYNLLYGKSEIIGKTKKD